MPLIEDLDIRLIVLGGNPSIDLRQMECERILVTGFVDSIAPFFQNAMCFIAPLILGAGIKVKVLEAISAGVPVLTNNIGIEGIFAKDQTEYFHCETPGDYENIIRKLVSDRINLRQIEDNDRAFIEKYSTANSFYRYRKRLLDMLAKN